MPRPIAIVGGGFSGLLVLAHLVRQVDRPLEIHWYDREGTWGLGKAYGKAEPFHLLNVRADRMGAFPQQPADFWNWVQSQPESAGYGPESFLPRVLYGRYLAQLLAQTLALAAEKGIALRRYTRDVVGRAELPAGHVLVLATGNESPRAFAVDGDPRRYVADSWRSPLPDGLDTLSPEARVAIIGTGLTAVDCVLSVMERGFRGTVVLLSRHGWLPAEHRPVTELPRWDWLEAPDAAPRTALGLLRALRYQSAQIGDWRGVIDALRPVTRQLWQQLPSTEKRICLRRLFTLWSIHRHRMAPEIAARLRELVGEGRLELVLGSVQSLRGTAHDVEIFYRPTGSGDHSSLKVGLAVNCTGPQYQLGQCPQPLLRELLDQGVVRIDATGAGLELDDHGQAAPGIYPLGTLTVGAYFDTTAVRELREQAEAVAGHILKSETGLQTG